MSSRTESILFAGVAVGVAAALFNLIPLAGSCLACLAYIGAGVLAVRRYTTAERLTISGGQGAGIGALAAVVAGLVAILLSLLFMALELQPTWEEMLDQQFDASDMDPDQRQEMEALLRSPLLLVGIALFSLVVYAVVGAIGGAIGASMFKKGPDDTPFGEESPTAF